jgi:predicted nucleic acid-binding protein
MIAIDTSSFIAYFAGDTGNDVLAVDQALADKQVVLPPAVLAELLSAPKLTHSIATSLKELPLLSLKDGYWERVGSMRARLVGRGLKARLADALIAQSCIDHHVHLITRDNDFRHFVEHANLKIL